MMQSNRFFSQCFSAFSVCRAILVVFLACIGCSNTFAQPVADPIAYVNPFIGTGGHGHTFPGATLPFGFVQVSPDTDDKGWDWSSGYHYSDSSIMGFSHTHLSGTGISDLADVLVMPYIGKIRLLPGEKHDLEADGYRSAFRHDTEIASPGYYAVTLEKHGIRAELTCTEQVAYHRYTFPETDSAQILVDLLHGLDRHRSWLTERVLDAEIRVLDAYTLTGYRISSGWANVQPVYFEIRFSQPMTALGLATHEVFRPGSTLARGRNVKAVLSFAAKAGIPVEMQVSLSPVPFSVRRPAHDARLSFNDIRRKAEQAWREALSAIRIEAPDSVKTIFYTALYHTAMAPNRLWHPDGSPDLSTLSQWDVYRAAFALHTIIRPQLVDELLQAMLQAYHKNGYLPVWKLWHDEVNCMIGTPSVPMVVEAVLKGHSAKAEELYEAVYTTLTTDNPVAPWSLFDRYGYVPNDVGELFSVSKTLEMCYANGCAALLARQRGDSTRLAFYEKRAGYYRNLFDSDSGFFRGKDRQGRWTSPFDPTVTNEQDFVEATPWQYLFHLQHDVEAMIQLHGSRQGFADKLDALFQAGPAKIDEHILDITGLMGQYAHGNEPSHHVAYLYNYAGQPWKTQSLVRDISTRFYTAQPEGLCGNEDAGQMSAWYIFSALGFYPVHPASGMYDLGAPLVEKARIQLPSGKSVSIQARPYGDAYRYVQSVSWNGKRLMTAQLSHVELMQGGELIFEMRSQPLNKAQTK
jgi:predicted alpha-1,2-mannosidase